MSCGKFRTAEDYRDHLPCQACEPSDRPHGEAGANARIAELESRIRQGETFHREELNKFRRRSEETIARHVAQHAADQKTLTELRLQVLDLDARIQAMHMNSSASSETAAAACERLIKYEPVIKAARKLCAAYKDKDDEAGSDACVELMHAVEELPPEPS